MIEPWHGASRRESPRIGGRIINLRLQPRQRLIFLLQRAAGHKNGPVWQQDGVQVQTRQVQWRGWHKMRLRVFEIDDVDIVDGVSLVGFSGGTPADEHDFLILRRRHNHTR